MFGVRIIVFACALVGASVFLPLDLVEAQTRHQDSYSRAGQKSYAQRHRGTYAQRRSGKSYAHNPTRKAYAQKSTAKSYAHESSGKDYSQLQVKASGSARVGARPSRWCGWWMRTQKGGGPELNLARNWAHWGRPSGPKVGAVVVWSHHVGMITGRSASGQWIVKSGNDGGQVRERPRSVAGAVFRTGASA